MLECEDFQSIIKESPSSKHWEQIGIKNHHGIVLPLFSIHNEDSCGVGEFPLLEKFVPWCKDLGLDVIQLLPLNEVNRDNSPFSGMSAFALDPMYLGLSRLPNLATHHDLLEELKNIQSQFQQKEGEIRRVNYNLVRDCKRHFLHKYLERERVNIINSPEYREYFDANQSWLKGYSVFKILKSKNHWKPWWVWNEFKNPTEEEIEHLLNRYSCDHQGEDKCLWEDEVITQYLCYLQMKHVKEVANSQGVYIKGDIPFLISRDSSDVWLPSTRKFFSTECSAGAPPDSYNDEGQNWGVPVYDWTSLKESEYWWWIERLRYASYFFDIYRIDHIVGFFRVWAIQEEKKATEGEYFPTDSELWEVQGKKHLTLMIENSEMLPIGEDLGTLPDCCRPTLKKLGICGTKVVIWEREWEKKGKPFIPFEKYDKCSMTTVSTHDTEPLRMWWEKHPDESKALCESMKIKWTEKLSPEYQKQILKCAHQSGSLFHINNLLEYLYVVPELAWKNIEDDRINIPGKLLESNWTYCFKPSVDQITQNESLKSSIREIVENINYETGGAGN